MALKTVPNLRGESRIIFLPKLGQSEYFKLRDFRNNRLTSFDFERLVNRFNKNIVVELPFSFTKYVSRKGNSTERAVHDLVAEVENQMEDKDDAVSTFLDSEGAFSISHYDVIDKAMSKKRVS